jgi:nucleoside 2-deoxyribosyltransferase
MTTSFVGYASWPPEVGATIRSALELLKTERPTHHFKGWEENDIAGRFISEPILDEISSCDMLSADITRLNFNVTYEIGFAIGKGRPVYLIRNSAIVGDDALIREIGIFDTLGYKSYTTARNLVSLVTEVKDLTPLLSMVVGLNPKSPVYVVLPKIKTDSETELLSRVKKAFRVPYRSFDPEEHGRLSAVDAIRNVALSYGAVVPLLANTRTDAQVHNIRAAFVAGLAHGMDKELLLLQFGDDPVPLDYRDLVKNVAPGRSLDTIFSDFAPDVFSHYEMETAPVAKHPGTLLQELNLGASSAENEMSDLAEYYLETEEYRRVSRGEAQIVTGRKGSGKTALFVQLRNHVRRNRQHVVLDLRPEGFQLLKLKDVILAYLEQGTKEHTITAFWEYLLLLEICHKLLEKDRQVHLKNHTIYEPYRALATQYAADAYVVEADFAERMSKLMQRIMREFKEVIGSGKRRARLSAPELTNILYQHDTRALRDQLCQYLQHKQTVWILFDNLDKGWPATGVGPDDILILRCLIDAVTKLERTFRKQELECYGVIFLRNDVYELLLEHTPDRGKTSRAILDWTDPELLRELLRLRFISQNVVKTANFDDIWHQIVVSHIAGEESSSYVIERCLMRPRSLIDFLQYCRSHALNLGHAKIESDDILKGEESYSSELVANIGFEIRDVFPEAGDVLYEFIGAAQRLSRDAVTKHLFSAGIDATQHDQLIDLLLWYGFLGIVRESGEIAYIYTVSYDRRRLKALMKKDPGNDVFFVNPAFWVGLEIR